jgi:hypothetical protein
VALFAPPSLGISGSRASAKSIWYTSAIWLRQDTQNVINAYVNEALEFIKKVSAMDTATRLPHEPTAKTLLNQKLEPAFSAAEAKLREELETGSWWWRRISKRRVSENASYETVRKALIAPELKP